MTALVIPTEAALPVSGPPQGHWTYADWEKLGNDGKRYEIIDGVLYFSDVPSVFHQWIVSNLLEFTGFAAEDARLAYAIQGPVGVQLSDQDVVQPDFTVVRSENVGIIRDRRIRGVPDAIVEVLSPGNAAYDQQVKREAYERAGVTEYVIVDPGSRALSRYQLDQQGRYDPPRVVAEAETFAFACLPTIAFRVGDLFAGAPDTTL